MHVMEGIYSFGFGGSEQLAALLTRHIKRMGVQISVCATHGGKGPISDALEAEGIPCFAMRSETRSRIGQRLALYSLFKQKKVDIFHGHHVMLYWFCYWPAKLAGVRKLILTEHTDYELRTIPRYRRTAKAYSRRADLVTVVHEGLRRYFTEELGAPRNKVITIPNGVDTSHFTPGNHDPAFRRALGLDSEGLLLGWIGRIHEDKHLDSLIRAFRIVVDTMDQRVILVIVGDGPDRAHVQQVVHEQGLSAAVHFLGPRQDIDNVLKNLDALVLCSRTEGAPLVLLEAMSSGVPCVATAVGGVPEIITDDVGILVPPMDHRQLAEGIIALAKAPDLRLALATNARKRAVEEYDLNNMLASYTRSLGIT